MSAASSLHHSRQRCGSISASMSNSSDSASLRSGGAASWQASVRSGMSKEKGGGLWSRRGSVAPKSLRSTRSKGSTRSGHREGSITSGSDQAFEMTAVPLGGRGKKKVLIENEAARQNRAKADAAMAKWRVSAHPHCVVAITDRRRSGSWRSNPAPSSTTRCTLCGPRRYRWDQMQGRRTSIRHCVPPPLVHRQAPCQRTF